MKSMHPGAIKHSIGALAGAAILSVAACSGGSSSGSSAPTSPPVANPPPPSGRLVTWDPDPWPAQWVDTSGLFSARYGQIRFEARDGNDLTALVYRASDFDPDNGPVWFVMHGASRDAERYIRTAAPAAERHAALAIAIHFTKSNYPGSSDYTLGVTTTGSADGTALREGRWRETEDFLYSEIEHVFEAVRQTLNGSQQGYYLFGHSAGAQFTHRLITFLPRARVLGAAAANAGWYTLPVDNRDPDSTMPYGLQGTPLNAAERASLLAAPLAVMIGERDTLTPAEDSLLRGTPEAMAQGESRFERGQYFYSTGMTRAQADSAEFDWQQVIVPKAGHNAAQVLASAAFYLFEPNETPCLASTAADATGLSITEILADPPDGAAGDANADTERSAAADEFVEIYNGGSSAICLAGWSLGDAENSLRHVFPLGRALAPGEALVVFGGGTPTGVFAGAQVQWAAFDGRLDLSNAGDVLSLRDAGGDIVAQVSWGDCAGATCTGNHWPGNLEIDGSITRWPGSAGSWVRHDSVASRVFSPGARTDGSPW